jgi:hypothetical protein
LWPAASIVLGKLSGSDCLVIAYLPCLVPTLRNTFSCRNGQNRPRACWEADVVFVCLLFLLAAAASIVLGKLSGRKAVSTRLEQLGFGLSAEEVNDVFKRFKVRGSASNLA